MSRLTFESAKEYVGYVVDDSLNGRRIYNDIHAVIKPTSVLVGWQCGFEPMFVAVNSYLDVEIPDDEAEELAIDYLKKIQWFSDCNADNYATYIIRNI